MKMRNWSAPILETLSVSKTQNGALPATYEASYAGRVTLDGVQYAIVSGYVASSGVLQKPYICDPSGSNTYYEGEISDAIN
jgi:hypothetical protein